MSRVACVQLGDGDAGPSGIARVSAAIADAEADLVVLPELWPVGYFHFDRYDDAAEPVDGPTAAALSAVAAEHRIHLHAGSIVERRSDGRLSNTSLLFGPTGELLLSYRKHHLFGYGSDEQRLLTPGDELDVVATPLGAIGMTTCYDLRFPELYRKLVDAGAEIVLVASAWPHARLDHWRLLTRTRALENQVYVAAANAAGTDNGVRLGGHSVVVDPWGAVLAEAGEAPDEVVAAEIERDRVAAVRDEFPVLLDRRY